MYRQDFLLYDLHMTYRKTATDPGFFTPRTNIELDAETKKLLWQYAIATDRGTLKNAGAYLIKEGLKRWKQDGEEI